VVQLFLTFGAALVLASINLFFRDIGRLVNTLTMLVFYCTPIIYSETMIPQRYHWLLHANPIAPLMTSWRMVLIEGRILPYSILWGTGYALLILFVGHRVYDRFHWRFAEVL